MAFNTSDQSLKQKIALITTNPTVYTELLLGQGTFWSLDEYRSVSQFEP